MNAEDIRGFFADRDQLNMADYLELEYYLECIGDIEEALAHFCSEQSTAQWSRIGYDEDFRDLHAAKVIRWEVLEELAELSYPVEQAATGRIHACRVTIAHPYRNFGAKLPNLLTAVCGEGTYFTPGVPLVKLLDITFPDSYLQQFEGPKFGIDGIRDMLGAYNRPVFFGVVKPNIGLRPDLFADIAYESWLGGLDIAKDDEMLADVEWSTTRERSELLGKARSKAEEITGDKKIYLANITDEVDRMIEQHDVAVKNGANALLINAMPVGLSAVRMLRKHTQVPLIGHFPFIASFARLEKFGVHTRVITKLQRLAGLDAIIMPGFGNRMMTPEAEVRDNVNECLAEMGSIKPSLPVPGGSDSALTLETVYRKVGSVDFGFVPGRGIFGHPMGPKAGARSIRQAWEAIEQDIALDTYAKSHPELQAMLDK
ncbi:ribulose 1,5-bisphosphate carboxylase [Prosthecochloris sp. N3]|uniref:Ribulose 1,5-bisphosphate carboxylase n=1 Tax=Prosthecochloris ethylica TaxID=2743976 RepID=A0ABR9XUZ3_9CHLB|nr:MULTISPECIES: RuBisCO large subunit C-terminal-like domain-containing protein [Prosthecochloris]MEC9487296.1 RuBisCO large subunit C-terminal-like domain-containing protein [Prosthecochloris sp.]MBF0587400.1 ribulose 1,5-bisphosphate carboxylase [Prosthecochloris ethylica]MBF0637600.1 ribulose 1,5-bisphosphate carboxylase [Prosthecochloris ethylica]NUK48627.1 ribulose 1,5-bisphosphate carboxylase [Prosthecochloris ethylica]RNA65352.1 ribulose 1,5-bisphosphate carboxylase [Prosthecochloris s